MAATIHQLHPGTPPHGVLLRNELRDGYLRLLDALAREVLDQADDTLFRISEGASGEAERQATLAPLRALRLGRDSFLKTYVRELVLAFNSGNESSIGPIAVDYGSLSQHPTEELEERIALAATASRVDVQHTADAQALERRLDMARAAGLGIPLRLLAAQPICSAIARAGADLRCGFETKLIVYKLFERALCRDYPRLLAVAGAALDRHGIGVDAGRETEPSATPPPAARATPWNVATRGDAPTAAWFDALLATPSLSTRMRIAFEAMRQPLAQRGIEEPALADDPEHPVRQRLRELVELATAVAGDSAAAPSFNIVLETALGSAADTAAPSLDRLLLRLREQLRDQRTRLLRQRRAEVLREIELRSFGRPLCDRVRTLLRTGIAPLMALHLLNDGRNSEAYRDADELCDRLLASLDVEPPVSASEQAGRHVLQAELRLALARIGIDGAQITDLLDGLIQAWAEGFPPLPDAVPEPADAPLPDEEPRLVARPSSPIGLAASPPPAAPVVSANDAEPEPDPVAADAAASPTALMARVLLPESWFRVYEPAQNQTRWLKLASFYPTEDQVTFSGFDESKRLSLRASRVIRDLLDGRSEAINPSADTRAALDALRALDPPPEVRAGGR